METGTSFLDLATFNTVVRSTPLIAIDFILINHNDQIMLGLRRNRPAKDYWFVPGGRILKNESIRDAFRRIAENEFDVVFQMEEARFLGVYEHFHSMENFSGEKGYGTHYIVLAFEIRIGENRSVRGREQHSSYRWFDRNEVLEHPSVHLYTRNYFNGTHPVK